MTWQDITLIESTCTESQIQHTCVSWFRRTFPQDSGMLFAVPNGGWRGARAGARMVYEGQVKGVADLILMPMAPGQSALCLETKVPRGKKRSAGTQSAEQSQWQKLVESHGNTYAVCHGLMEFIEAVCSHLSLDTQNYKDEALRKYPLY